MTLGYDTVGFRLNIPSFNPESIEIYLTNPKEIYKRKINYAEETFEKDTSPAFVKGNIKNLVVKGNHTGVSIVGSISKFYYGSNIYSMKFSDVQAAIEMISDSLHLQVSDSILYRVDISGVFEVKSLVDKYLLLFQKTPPYKMSVYEDSGVKYRIKYRSIVFYDKIRKMLKDKELIPDEYINRNLLRYEIVFNKRISRQLKMLDISAASLCDANFYNKLLLKYQNIYEKLNKARDLRIIDFDNISGIKELIIYLALRGMQAYEGIDKIIDQLEIHRKSLKKRSIYTPVIKTMLYRLKSKLYEIYKDDEFTASKDLVTELNQDIIKSVKENWIYQ